MVGGNHREFDHSKIIARLTDKHLVDISCPGSSWPSLSEKPPPTHICERDFRPDPVLSLDLLKNCILNNSVTRNFYCYLLNEPRYKLFKTLVDRSNIFCQSNNVNLVKYIFSHDYMLKVKKSQKNLIIINLVLMD